MMNNKEFKFSTVLYALHLVLTVAAVVLSIVSSNKAYAITGISTLVIAGVVAAVLDIVSVFLLTKGLGIIADVVTWLSVALSMYLMCGMINGRLKLMGYVWFSDLESGNATAVGALNLTVVSWVCVVLGIICLCVKGFKRENA